jgi:hypothetical protein
MASKRQTSDSGTTPHSAIWEIRASELPDRASEVWGRCREEHPEVTTTTGPKGKPKRRPTGRPQPN